LQVGTEQSFWLRAGTQRKTRSQRPGSLSLGDAACHPREGKEGDRPVDRRTLRLLLGVLAPAELSIVLVILSN